MQGVHSPCSSSWPYRRSARIIPPRRRPPSPSPMPRKRSLRRRISSPGRTMRVSPTWPRACWRRIIIGR
ncbi:MAG: hypothetical protein EPO07_09690 [Verrucomicrobia bacterium]|nr:MAG: hypothetical protein EPO07_09690 [Verrucomicrobiota bacterium]